MSKTFPIPKKAMSEPKTPAESHSSHPLSVTAIFWIIIMLLIFIISLSAALMVEWWGKIPETSPAPQPVISQPTEIQTSVAEPESPPANPENPPAPPKQPPPPPAPPPVQTSITWKEIAQRLQQSEQVKTEVFANLLKKLPELAPLPQPQATKSPAPPKAAPAISWKVMSLQLESVEKQQGEMLRKLFEKTK